MHLRLQSGFSPWCSRDRFAWAPLCVQGHSGQNRHLRGYHHRGQYRHLRKPFGAGLGNSLQKLPTHLGNPKQQCPASLAAVGLCPAILFILWVAFLTPCVLCFWYPQWSSKLLLCDCHDESVSRATALPWDVCLWLWASGKCVPEDWSDQVSSDSYVKPAAGRQGKGPVLNSLTPAVPFHLPTVTYLVWQSFSWASWNWTWLIPTCTQGPKAIRKCMWPYGD